MYLNCNANTFDDPTTTSLDEIRDFCGHKMYSSTTTDPCSCMEYTEHRAVRINQDSRDREDGTIAEAAGIVANLNEKIHLLRKEILELKDSGKISASCVSVVEKNSPPGLHLENEAPARPSGRSFLKMIPSFSFFKKKLVWTNECDEHRCGSRLPIPCSHNLVITETETVNEQRRMNEKIESGDKNYGGREIGSESISTSSESCSFDDISCGEKFEKARGRTGRDKSTYVELEKSNKSVMIKTRYGRRVRKRISRGVQTLPNERRRSSRVKRKIGYLFNFKWRSRRRRGKEKENCNCADISATSHAAVKSVDVQIYTPRRWNERKDTVPDRKSDNVKFAVRSDKKPRKQPTVKVNRNNMTKNNYKRKYEFTIDGIVRAGDGSPKVTEKSGTTTSPERRSFTGRRERSKSKGKAGTVTAANDGDLSSPEWGISKTGKMNKITKSHRSNDTVSKNDSKDTPATGVKTDKPVVSVAKNSVKELERNETKKASAFKSFTRSVRTSFATHRQPKEESHEQRNNDIVPRSSEPTSKRWDTNRNDITDVKKRLDICVADLNDIISHLSKVFQQDPTPGGPAGEAAAPGNINFTPRGRARFR